MVARLGEIAAERGLARVDIPFVPARRNRPAALFLESMARSGMNGVYQTFFPEPRPARATVRADLIVGKVEIDCIALVPQ